jgi:hypothetical protein
VLKEAGKFWAKEKIGADTFQQRLEDAAISDLNLPDDIMPYFVSYVAVDRISELPRPGKKQKKWGPVQPIRQSTRTDLSKNIMEKAEERKRIINLEKPKMKGIMSSNPFSVLPIDELDTMADKFGVDINDDTVLSFKTTSSSYSMPSSCRDERQEELAELWIDVVRKSWG